MPMIAMKTHPERMALAMADELIADIRIADPAWESWQNDLDAFVSNVLTTASGETGQGGQIDLLLTGDDEIHELNRQWRDKDKPTDILSFPSDEFAEPGFLGDIAISMGVMTRDAEKMKKDPKDHFSHLLVHGYLHLLGYDHQVDDEADEMEGLEVRILAELGISNPYFLGSDTGKVS